jgi:nucleoside phosphorylase
MIVCAGDSESFSFATPIGIGLINSAINLTRLCLLNKPDFLLFVGSAGSYDKNKYKIFDIVESTSASNIELGFLNNDCYTPLQNVLNSQTKLVQNQTIVNSSNYISTNEQLANKFIKYNIHIENMEFYSLLQVAKEFDIPIAGIFVITNYTNKEAHKDFLNNHKEAMRILTSYLVEKKIIK